MIVEAVSRLGWSEVATANSTPPATRASPLHLSRRADSSASSAITAPSEGKPNPQFGTVVLQCIPSHLRVHRGLPQPQPTPLRPGLADPIRVRNHNHAEQPNSSLLRPCFRLLDGAIIAASHPR